MRWYASIRRSAEIAYVRRRGRSAGTQALSAFVVEARAQPSRVAVTVASAVGCAAVRNRVKRRIKGALDRRAIPTAPVRLVVIARPAAASQPYRQLAEDLSASLTRLGIG